VFGRAGAGPVEPGQTCKGRAVETLAFRWRSADRSASC